MPKNNQGEVVCINHPEQVLTNQSLVQFPHVGIGTNEQGEKGISHMNTGLPAKVRFCDQCGYMEIYTIREEDYIPK